MANASIPGLPVAITLDGTEQLEIVQPPGTDGTTKRATSGQIAALAASGGTVPISPFVTTTLSTGLPQSRFLDSQTGVLSITDNGAQSSIVVGVVANGIGDAQLRQSAGLSVVGNTTNATGNVADVTGTTDQVLRVAANGTALGFGQVNLSATSAVTGFLATSYITGSFSTGAFTGVWPVSLGGTGTSTLTANGVLVGNGTSSVQIATANTAGYVLTDNGTGSVPTFQPAGGLSQQAGLSVLGVSTTSTAIPSAIIGTTDQVLRVNTAGTGLTFGRVNLSTAAAVTGILTVPFGGTGTGTLTSNGLLVGNGTSSVGVVTAGTAGQLLIAQTTTSNPQFATSTGDVTYSAVGTATIATNAVTYTKFQQMPAFSVFANSSSATTNATAVVGTTGQVLRVNAAGTGLTFGQVNLSNSAAVTGVLSPPNGGEAFLAAGYATGRYQFFGSSPTTATSLVVASRLYVFPAGISSTATWTKIGIKITTATGSVGRLGIYNWSGGVPTTLALDAGTISSSTTGEMTATISTTLAPGVYGLACVFDNTPAVLSMSIASIPVQWVGQTTLGTVDSFIYQDGVTAGSALPSSFSGTSYGVFSVGNAMPAIWLMR